MTIPTIRLNDGHTMPQIGLGTAALNDDKVAPVIVTAIEVGYRHIDTAYRYGNQRGVGKGIKDSGINREELFVTTKLDGEFQGNERAIAGLDECLRQLGLDYVDLLLIHWPLPQRDEYISTWKTFEKPSRGRQGPLDRRFQLQAYPSGPALSRSHHPPHGQPDSAEPSYYAARECDYDRAHDIVTVAWSPLGQGNDLLNEPTLATIAAKYGKTSAQVTLRWNIDLGDRGDSQVVEPRAARPEHRYLRLHANPRRDRRHLGARYRRGAARRLRHWGALMANSLRRSTSKRSSCTVRRTRGLPSGLAPKENSI